MRETKPRAQHKLLWIRLFRGREESLLGSEQDAEDTHSSVLWKLLGAPPVLVFASGDPGAARSELPMSTIARNGIDTEM